MSATLIITASAIAALLVPATPNVRRIPQVVACASSADARFGDLPLPPTLAASLHACGVTAPTAIQQASSMDIHRGGHVVLHSETGSGKTYAYLLPLLARLHMSRPNQLLIVVPSRELALQTAAVVERVWEHHGTRRAFVLAGTPPPAQTAEQLRLAACPVLIATPRPLLALVKHLAGTDRLHSRRAIATSGDALLPLVGKLRAIVLDEADALLLDRELAIAGPPKRRSHAAVSGGGGEVKAPERFTKPSAKAVQAILKARTADSRSGRGGYTRGRGRGRGARGSDRRGDMRRGRGGGRGGRGGGDDAGVQLVACSATASFRLREELCRLFGIAHEANLRVISAEDAASGGSSKQQKRAAGDRGLGGVSVPTSIVHSWVSCADERDKALAVKATLSELSPRCALLFLADDAPLRATVGALRDGGLDAVMLHEAMGFGSGEGGVGSEGELRADGYESLSSALASAEASGDACKLLVSTHSSARGLDIASVDCVMLYELPSSADQYLHLAGRTGRQGRSGAVVSLLAPHESGSIGKVTRQLGISIKQHAAIALALDEARNGQPAQVTS